MIMAIPVIVGGWLAFSCGSTSSSTRHDQGEAGTSGGGNAGAATGGSGESAGVSGTGGTGGAGGVSGAGGGGGAGGYSAGNGGLMTAGEAGLAGNGTYAGSAGVAGLNGAAGIAGSAGAGPVCCGLLPYGFTITYPTSTEQNMPVNPEIQWAESVDPCGGNIEYELIMSTSPSFATVERDISGIINASRYALAPTESLAYDTRYYYYLKAHNACGETSTVPTFFKTRLECRQPLTPIVDDNFTDGTISNLVTQAGAISQSNDGTNWLAGTYTTAVFDTGISGYRYISSSFAGNFQWGLQGDRLLASNDCIGGEARSGETLALLAAANWVTGDCLSLAVGQLAYADVPTLPDGRYVQFRLTMNQQSLADSPTPLNIEQFSANMYCY